MYSGGGGGGVSVVGVTRCVRVSVFENLFRECRGRVQPGEKLTNAASGTTQICGTFAAVWRAISGRCRVKGGYVHGSTDEFGWNAVENRVHVHDLHATILRLLGFDHEKLTYRYAGRDFRLTDVHGHVVDELLA